MPKKGVYQQLVESQSFTDVKGLRDQRVVLIKRIQELRQRPLVSYVTSLTPFPKATAYISHEDKIPFGEILDSVEGNKVDVLIESPGGLSEVAVELGTLLRNRFQDVAFIVPHAAMSAATMLVMSGDDILMDYRSALGAIDPQFVGPDGRPQPAQAVLNGLDTIKRWVDENKGVLHPAYIPILRSIDPGKLQSALDASELSVKIVTEYLVKYKFRTWTQHSKTGDPVTNEQREERAESVARELCDHQKWLSHSHPIKIDDLEKLKVKITNYATIPELQDAVWALWVHYYHFLSSTNTYKVYESEFADFYKLALPVIERFGPQGFPMPIGALPQGAVAAGHVSAMVGCTRCGAQHKVQANFGAPQKLEAGAEAFPRNCTLTCKGCGNTLDLTGLKMQIEARVKKNLVFEVIV